MYELFGDSLNICHLPVFQTKEYKFKVDWALGQKDKLPSSKMSCEKSPTEDSLFQANDDFEFVRVFLPTLLISENNYVSFFSVFISRPWPRFIDTPSN